MKCTTDRREFLVLLGKVKPVVAHKHRLPILQSVFLKARKGELTATATDLESALTSSCKAGVVKGGAVCVRPKSLEAFLKAVSTDEIILSSTGKTVHYTVSTPGHWDAEKQEFIQGEPEKKTRTETKLKLEAGSASVVLDSFSPEDFPPVPPIKGKPTTIKDLTEALKGIAYAMATEDTRPVLNAICFNPQGKETELAAADGFRLAIARVIGKIAKPIIVPSSAIRLLMRLMLGDVQMRYNGTGISFATNGLTLTTKEVQGTYPDYPQLIPQAKEGSRLKVETAELQNALKVVSAVGLNSGILRLEANNGKVKVWGKTDDMETVQMTIPGQGKAKAAYNYKYLKDILNQVEGKITMLVHPTSPGVVKHKKTTHVLMPMHAVW